MSSDNPGQKPGDNALAGLEYEIAGEKARALGIAAEKLVAALAALAEHDASGDPAGGRAAREELVLHAAERLWYYVVHREALGWNRHDEALAFYRVPGEIRARMGPRPRSTRRS